MSLQDFSTYDLNIINKYLQEYLLTLDDTNKDERHDTEKGHTELVYKLFFDWFIKQTDDWKYAQQKLTEAQEESKAVKERFIKRLADIS